MNSKIYSIVFVAIVLFLIPFFIGHKALQVSDQLLVNIQTRQLGLIKYTINLEQEIKKNQADILQAIILGDTDSVKLIHNSFFSLDNRLKELEKFAISYADENVDEIIKKLKIRMIGYKAIEASIIDAITREDKLDAEDALIGYNSVSKKFSDDVEVLRSLADTCLERNMLKVENSNKDASIKIFLSSFSALTLILFAILKLYRLNHSYKNELERADAAEMEQKKLQLELQNYSNSLEEDVRIKSEELHHRLYYHPLTSLPNRNALLEDIQKFNLHNITLFNIDNFQEFNDLFGEEIGNSALILTANFLKENQPSENMHLYHIGGDEFAYVSVKPDYTPSGKFVAEIKKILEEYKATEFHSNENSFRLVMSSGISFDTKKMLTTADISLKEAKAQNIALHIYDLDHDHEAQYKDNIAMAEKLISALDNNRLISHFQPIVPISDMSKPAKYESLARLQDKDGTIIAPYKFIDISKKVRLYPRLTAAVLKNTLSTIEKYKINCSFNLSIDDIENRETYDILFKAFNNFKYCNLLTIELLETEAVYDYDKVVEFIKKVHALDISVAIDDFGSGYSNFAHILNIKIDYIKIDSSLVSNIDINPQSRIMVETIVSLAKKLGVCTIAEFVSSEDIYNVLRDIGVDYAQGYYISKPGKIESILNQDIES